MRLSLNRRVVLVTICCASGILLFINIINSSFSDINFIKDAVMNNRTAIKDLDSGETEESLFNIINKKENLSEIKVKTNEINAESVEENFLVRDQKPWYFSNGNILPTVQNKSRNAFLINIIRVAKLCLGNMMEVL